MNCYLINSVPRTGFEPAHPCERCHLKAVRLPISPSGQLIKFQGGEDKVFFSTKKLMDQPFVKRKKIVFLQLRHLLKAAYIWQVLSDEALKIS